MTKQSCPAPYMYIHCIQAVDLLRKKEILSADSESAAGFCKMTSDGFPPWWTPSAVQSETGWRSVCQTVFLMGEETCYFCMSKPCWAAILRGQQKRRRVKVAWFIHVFKLFSLLPKSTDNTDLTPKCSMNHQFWQVIWFIVLGVEAKELGEILVSQSLLLCWQSKWPQVQVTWSPCLLVIQAAEWAKTVFQPGYISPKYGRVPRLFFSLLAPNACQDSSTVTPNMLLAPCDPALFLQLLLCETKQKASHPSPFSYTLFITVKQKPQ